MSDYFGQSPDGYQKPLYGASNLSDVVDKPAALVNLGAASADDVLKAANPIGTIIAFYGSVAPYGYLPCSGQTVSSSTFPSLVTFLGGTTSATLPDLRGEFLRGWDNGRGIDLGRAVRTAQSATIITGQAAAATHTVSAANTGTDFGPLWGTEPVSSVPAGMDIVSVGPTGGSITTPIVGNLGYTRPRNISVLYCIKAYDTPVSAGILNVATLASEMALKTALTDFTGVNQNLNATSGYQKLPGGLIIQWGLNTATAANFLVTFPVTFPITPVSIVFGQNEATTSFNNNFLTTTGFRYSNAAATYPDAFTWISLGY